MRLDWIRQWAKHFIIKHCSDTAIMIQFYPEKTGFSEPLEELCPTLQREIDIVLGIMRDKKAEMPTNNVIYDQHAKLHKLANRLLDPEDLGLSATKEIRDQARIALGKQPVETN